MRPCEPLTAKQVWDVVSEVFEDNGLKAAYGASRRGYDDGRECFWMLVSGVAPHILDICVGQIGRRLETDFTMCAASGGDDGGMKFLISINAIQNATSVEVAAQAAELDEWNALKNKFRGFC